MIGTMQLDDASIFFFDTDFKPLFTISQVFHHVLDQQGRNGVHWPRNICLGHVPIEMLGLFPVSFLKINLVLEMICSHTNNFYNYFQGWRMLP